MLTSTIVVIAIFLFFLFFVFYKRDMLIKMFSLNASASSQELQAQLTKTADTIIKRLEEEISHLEFLLEEAEAKSAVLEKQLQTAEILLQQLTSDELLSLQSKPSLDPLLDDQKLQTAFRIAPSEEDTPLKDPASIEKRSLIIAMADQGYSITEIAKATELGKGEIMLLLHLHKK
jgi:hypothetical protein